MARPATTRLKVNPPLGTLPVLQYCHPDHLLIDETYQRGLDMPASQALIRRIAVHWDWGLCQPLFVARRADGGLYVVDGQHRLAAAKLRGDIWQLPCVVSAFEDAASEAAAFVALNQERRPLSKLQIFKAAVAAGDSEAASIVAAVEGAGLKIASSTNLETCPAGALSNIGGLQNCIRVHGGGVLACALDVMGKAYHGQVLRYAGTIFSGIAAIVATEIKADANFAQGEMFELMIEVVGASPQADWVRDINQAMTDGRATSRRHGSALVFEQAWAECIAELLDEAA
jgi:hypothetical protein